MDSLADQNFHVHRGEDDHDTEDGAQTHLGNERLDPGSCDLMIPGDLDSSANDQKRIVHETEHANSLTQTAANKFKIKTEKTTRYDDSAAGEIVASSDLSNPSTPAFVKSKGRARKAPLQEKNGDDNVSPIVTKKRLRVATRKKALKPVSNSDVIISIESDEGFGSHIDSEHRAAPVASLKRKSGLSVGEESARSSDGIRIGKNRITKRHNHNAAIDVNHQLFRHTQSTADLKVSYEEEDEFGEDDSMHHNPQSRQGHLKYLKPCDLGLPAYCDYTSARYSEAQHDSNQGSYNSHYVNPAPTQHRSKPHNFNHSGYHQYDSRALGNHFPPLPPLNRVATSPDAYQLGCPTLYPFSAAPSSATAGVQLDTGIIEACAITPHSNLPASVYSTQYRASADNSLANGAERPKRALGRIYINGGHEVLTKECPCCRRSFEEEPSTLYRGAFDD